jgi:hypothetical protein
MKHCAFGGTRFNYDAIEATALESVFVKFVERGIEDSLSRVFGRSLGGGFHSILENTDQSVCVNVQFLFFPPLRSGWHFEIGFDFVGRVMALPLVFTSPCECAGWM